MLGFIIGTILEIVGFYLICSYSGAGTMFGVLALYLVLASQISNLKKGE